MLIWLSYANLRAPFIEADGHLASDLANVLRHPDFGTCSKYLVTYPSEPTELHSYLGTPIGRLIRDTVIPTMTCLKTHISIQFSDLFPQDMLAALGVPLESLCGDLTSSDRIFSFLRSK